MCIFDFSRFSFCHIPGRTRWYSYFSNFVVCSSKSRSYSVHFSFFAFSVFLAIIQVLKCSFLIFHVFQFSVHIQVIERAFFFFHVFQYFLPCSMLYSVCVSFFTFFRFLAIFQVLQCTFLIFNICQCFLPSSR